MNRLKMYREYKRQGLRRAWSLSGMSTIAWGAAKVVLLAWLLIAAMAFIAGQAQAIQDAADNRVAARIANQQGEIEALRQILAACLGDKEGVLWIGDEAYLCGASSTGIAGIHRRR